MAGRTSWEQLALWRSWQVSRWAPSAPYPGCQVLILNIIIGTLFVRVSVPLRQEGYSLSPLGMTGPCHCWRRRLKRAAPRPLHGVPPHASPCSWHLTSPACLACGLHRHAAG